MSKPHQINPWISGLAAVVMTGSAAFGALADPAYDPTAWREDYAQLKQTLEKEYVNLAWFGSAQGGINLPRLDQRTQASLAAARTDAEARQALEQFIGAFHDGHFSVLTTQAAPAATPEPKVERAPFDANDPISTCAALGFLPTSSVAFSLPFETLPGFTLKFDGQSSVYRAGIITTAGGGRVGIIRIQAFRMRAFPAACTLGWENLVKAGKPLTNGAVRDAAYDQWLSAFKDEIAALKAAGVTVLLVDVGNNTGGDDSGDLFPRLLTDKPVNSAPLMMVASPTGAQYFDEQLSGIDEALKASPSSEATSALQAGRNYFAQGKPTTATPCDLSWVWRAQKSWTGPQCKRLAAAGYAGGAAAVLPRGAYGNQTVAYQLSMPSGADDMWAMWTGPVYVLTDAKTYSSAEMFTAVMQDNRIGKTVGVKTGGDGCGFMVEKEPLVLAHSRIRVRMSNCIRLRRDGGNEVAGITPDIPVLPTEGEDDRQRAVRALGAIEADTTKNGPSK
ncbi:S41 family peptidase [Asticcacaulis benevestitus]|uniref:Tail specific protease domain-containing protein n=1 Tax=Asticcacaulis benevestitus DSM 16100 = ATCC BAA-896 TaxID=1121022 RepID=V4PWI9_9CAUL|nr:S41 family peptidase [Asticcacaulis benevestitus]ESQ89945.1 hypothetical protein ABENE_13145 [Asticcacaulis benevestitus DSM 16100 = ATCC BAA-896]